MPSLLFILSLLGLALSFQVPKHTRAFPVRTTSIFLSDQNESENERIDEALSLQAQAQKVRLEAERMDAELTQKRIESLQQRLSDTDWLERNKSEEPVLVQKLEDLKHRLTGQIPPTSVRDIAEGNGETTKTKEPVADKRQSNPPSDVPYRSRNSDRFKRNPIAGFSDEELEVFVPAAKRIELEMPNATYDEQMRRFKEEALDNFIRGVIVDRVKKIKEREDLKRQYLKSNSRVEKETIKRQIDQLEEEQSDRIIATKSFYRGIEPMSDKELKTRLDTMSELPDLLQNMYKVQRGIDLTDPLELAAQLEHWNEQIQLLEQLSTPINGLEDEDREDAKRGFEAMPEILRSHFVKKIGLPLGSTPEQVVENLVSCPLSQSVSTTPLALFEETTADDFLPEYNDIEFVERSRFVEALMPSIAAMETARPSEGQMEQFVIEIIGTKTYGLRSKPERVMGGYYVRGSNQLEGDDKNDKLVAILNERLAKSSLSGELQMFFVPDPQLPNSEEVEMQVFSGPLLLITGNSPKVLYRQIDTKLKAATSLLGLVSIMTFSLGTCAINDSAAQRLGAAMAGADIATIQQILGNSIVIGTGLLGVQLVHELGHRAISWRDKIDVGFPNLIGSINLGLTGAITPFNAPPKNLKSLFDFSIVGPFSGMLVSLGLLVSGLDTTTRLDLGEQQLLPALPVEVVKSSALGGGIIEGYLGSGALQSGFDVLPLAPLAIVGFVGLISNALALLPLGHTDGGRIALSLFGRRGSFLVKSLSALTLCVVGLFGYDKARILFFYTVYTLIWQREVETPTQNEVDGAGEIRGYVAIVSALLVALTLLPLP